MTARSVDSQVNFLIDLQEKIRELADMVEDFARMVVTHR